MTSSAKARENHEQANQSENTCETSSKHNGKKLEIVFKGPDIKYSKKIKKVF